MTWIVLSHCSTPHIILVPHTTDGATYALNNWWCHVMVYFMLPFLAVAFSDRVLATESVRTSCWIKLKWLLLSWLLHKRKRELSDTKFEIGKPYEWMLQSLSPWGRLKHSVETSARFLISWCPRTNFRSSCWMKANGCVLKVFFFLPL